MIKVYRDFATKMTDSEIIRRYIFAGNGAVDLVAPSGKKHSYVFKKPSSSSVYPDDVIFVYALHDDKKLFYIGMISENKFRLTHNSRFLPDTEIVKGAYYIMNMCKHSEFASTSRMSIYHLGRCGRCGRPLEDEKSLKSGFGRTCEKIIRNKDKKTC